MSARADTKSSTQRVLLVDDDPDFLEATRMRLTGNGYQVSTAESVDEAKAVFAEGEFDIAILDLMLDQDDGGFQLAYHIKKARKEMPVIVCSGVKSETGMDFGAETPEQKSWIQCDEWLAKPVRFEELQARMEKLLGS
jgi:DNA-binding response OmpR family regulator